MPSAMPRRRISKGPTLRKFDVVGRDAQRRARILERIICCEDFSKILIEEGLMTPPELYRIVQQWILDVPPGYWPGYPDKVEIITEAFRKAYEISLELDGDRPANEAEVAAKVVEVQGTPDFGIPVVTYWIAAGHQFQAFVTQSDQQVTLILLTPDVPQNIELVFGLTSPENVWVVANQRDTDDICAAGAYPPEDSHDEPQPEERRANVNVFATRIFGEIDGVYDDEEDVDDDKEE